MTNGNMDTEYLTQLKLEKDNIDPSFQNAGRLLSEEIDRVEKGSKYTEVHNDKKMKLTEKVVIPVKEHPKFNFVGKLLGPQGNSLKRLQHETGAKMSILGRGSMRDKKKEDDLRKEGDPKYAHLGDDLHVFVEVFAAPHDAHRRMANALEELTKFMIPDFNDEIRQQQLQELMYLNGEELGPAGQAGPPVPQHAQQGPPMRGRGRGRGEPPVGRGAPRGAPHGAHGAHGAPHGAHGAGPHGAPALLATPPGRGRPAPRGAPPSRGAHPPSRARGVPPGRPMPQHRPAPPPAYEEEYAYAGSTHNGGGYDDGYGQETYHEYDQGYGNGAGDSQYYDYDHGQHSQHGQRQAREPAYEDYGECESWGQAQTSYGKTSIGGRGKGEYRSHPYAPSTATRGARY